jgi:galactose mutarotase-like enzyme
MIQLSNADIRASIHPLGAELRQLSSSVTGLDYLWSGDPAWWGKFSPVLFPIVGTLRDNHYVYLGTTYTLPRHGFAREKLFRAEQISESEAIFTLEDDESTGVVYPFRFILQIRYLIADGRMTVTYAVFNPTDEPLFFSLGAHPAFRVPIQEGLSYDQYKLTFSVPETTSRWTLSDGLIRDESVPLLNHEQVIPLTTETFARDAIVLKDLRSDHITLHSDLDAHGLRFGIEGWPHLGLWAAPGAPFVCIEPWQGHADTVSHDGEFTRKPGIVHLESGGEWSKSWWVELF